jgi:sialic acid synthase SpsE
MKIGNFDTEKKVFIIAELSVNHAGDINIAKETIKKVKEIGADAIKLQTYTPEWITIDSKKDDFIIKGGTLWDGKNLFELYKEAKLPLEWYKELFEYARSIGINIFFSPLSKEAVDLLEEFNPSVDKDFSLDPSEFTQMLKAVRDTEKLLGKVDYSMNEKKKKNRQFSRSLYVVKDIKKGEKFTNENVKSIRPGFGLHPKYLPEILGKTADKDYKVGDRFEK